MLLRYSSLYVISCPHCNPVIFPFLIQISIIIDNGFSWNSCTTKCLPWPRHLWTFHLHVKGKVFPALNKISPTPIRRMGNGYLDPHFLDLGTSWKSAVSFTPRPLYPRGRNPSTHWIGGWVDTRTSLDDVEKTKFLPLPGLELRPLRLPAHS
jgi:hypothetical protein